jgi:hypothetical protein
MWVNLGHTSDAVEKITVQHVQIEFSGQYVPFIAASKTRGKVEKESSMSGVQPKRYSGRQSPAPDTSMM